MKLLALAFALASFSTFAATSDTLFLKGKVPSILKIKVFPEAIANTLPLAVSQANTPVASVEETSNSVTGYKVTITSANLGQLKNTASTSVFNYVLNYAGNNLNLTTSNVFSYPVGTLGLHTRNVTISYTGVPAENMEEGIYTDTVTFVIAAN